MPFFLLFYTILEDQKKTKNKWFSLLQNPCLGNYMDWECKKKAWKKEVINIPSQIITWRENLVYILSIINFHLWVYAPTNKPLFEVKFSSRLRFATKKNLLLSLFLCKFYLLSFSNTVLKKTLLVAVNTEEEKKTMMNS